MSPRRSRYQSRISEPSSCALSFPSSRLARARSAAAGARSREHLLYLDEFKGLTGVKLHVTTDDGSMGWKGHTVGYLEKLLAESAEIEAVFGCGPERMLKALSDLCARKKLPAQLSLERYMKCGYGLCGNCAVDPLGLRLCVDGPVVGNDICQQITELGQYHRDSLGKKHAC